MGNIKIKQMGHAAILVEDVKESAKFYKEVLGLNSVWEGDDDWANFEKGGDDLSLVRKSGAVHPPHIGFYVESKEDLESAHKTLKKTPGVEVQDLEGHRDGTASFYFKDPDGNLLELLYDPRK